MHLAEYFFVLRYQPYERIYGNVLWTFLGVTTRVQFFIFYFIRLWGVISEIMVGEGSCPTPGASRPRPWGKKPREKGEGIMNIPKMKIWSSIRRLTVFCIFSQSPNQKFRVITARAPNLTSGKVFASAGAFGVN